MKKLFILFIITALIIITPAFASQEEKYGSGLKRTVGFSIGNIDFFSEISQKTMTADELCELYNIGLTGGFPLYKPDNGQPMNAYIDIHPDCQVPVYRDGSVELYKVSELGELINKPLSYGINGMFNGNKYFDLKDRLYTIVKSIRDYSDSCIRFVSDPDYADILLSVNMEFPYYDEYYAENGESTSGHSCELILEALQLSDPSNYTKTSKTHYPEEEVTNPTVPKFYVGIPSGMDIEEFTDAILAWYGDKAEEGSRGNGIAYMQKFLIDRGFLEGNADGNYGPKTAEAIKKLQHYYGLEENGIIDHKTLLHIYYDTVSIGRINTDPGKDLPSNISDPLSIPNITSIPDPVSIPNITSIPDSVSIPNISEYDIRTPSSPLVPAGNISETDPQLP